ncbi:MAG: hypothetical protein ACYDAM_04765 [Leptospirales bacterium]
MKILLAHRSLFWGILSGWVLMCGIAAPSRSMETPVTVRTRDMIRVLSTFFPKVHAKVVSVDGNRLSLDQGEKSGITAGMVLEVVQVGTAFRDPYTHIRIGFRETRIGDVEIVSVSSDGSEGIFHPDPKGPSSRPAVGDPVRVSGAPLPVAIVPASNYTDVRVLAHLARKLDGSSRFRAVDPFRVEISMNTLGLRKKRDPGSLVRLARLLGVKELIVADTTLVGKGVQLDLEAVSGTTGKEVARVSGMLSGVRPFSEDFAGGEGAPGIVTSKLPPLSNPNSVVTVPFIPRFVSIGDFRGNGGALVALSDSHRIYVTDLSGNAVHVKFEEANHWVSVNKHVFLSSGPIIPQESGKGLFQRSQIVVTNIIGGSPYSYVLDYDGKTLHRVWKHVKLYLRVVNLPGRGPTLLGQRMGVNRPFLGLIHRYEWVRDHFEKEEAVSWPPGITLFGTQPVLLDKKNVFLEVAADDHLEVFDANGDLRFKSPVFLGGYFDHFVYGHPHALLPVRQRNVHLKGRILTIESGGKGRNHPIVIVYKNLPMASGGEQFQGYQYGQIYFYQWTGVNWILKGKLARVKGFISDIALTQNPKTLKPELLVATEPVFNFMNIQNIYVNEGKLSTYSLPEAVEKVILPEGSAPSMINRPSGGTGR